MKITFQTQELENKQNRKVQPLREEHRESINHATAGVLFAGSEEGWLQRLSHISNRRDNTKSFGQLQQEAVNIDVGIRQDYMTLMSNIMSEEDYAKLQEEGFDFSSMNPEEAVTIVDKVKAELARSGQYITGYTDDLDMNTLAAALGSDTLARAVVDSFQSADIPVTDENISRVKYAWDMASSLDIPGDGAYNYMISNQAEPEIWDFYVAQSSGAESMTGTAPRYYAEDIQGYYAQSAVDGANAVISQETQDNLQKQMDRVITDTGLEITAQTRQNASWLMEQGLPITGENLVRLQKLQQVTFPITEDTFAKAVATAISKGKNPVHADLTETENLYRQAASMAEALLEGSDVTARRQLEEIRLRMTAEVNVKLLKSGFAIDTAPMEELLEALKRVEAQLADSYFPQDEQALQKYELYRDTTSAVGELPGMPAQIVGRWSLWEVEGVPTDNPKTLSQFYGEGKVLQEAYDKAQESYETLMTAPRKDLGDSIQKAFANVDDILEDLKLTVNEENQRAARILGYNRMELTVQNIELVRQTDDQVRSVISKMTPAATLKMIRDGMNPLKMSFEELENYFTELPKEYEENAESYSRFLYHLEQNKEINTAEREAYIGIYRLLRQIEKSDGAAIGTVINTGAELQFANLLSAVRTGKFRHMDVKVTDETGFIQDVVKGEKSISEQIQDGMAAAKEIMTQVSSDEEMDVQYRKMQLEQIRQAAQVTPESKAVLTEANVVFNANHLLAADSLLREAANPYKKWREKAEGFGLTKTVEEIDSVENVLEIEDAQVFKEEYQEALKQITTAVERATTENAESSVDVRELQLVHKQLTVMTSMSDSQEYILPMYIGDELGRVHLTMVRGKEQKGNISIEMDWSENAHVEAHLQVSDSKVTGYLVGNTQEEVRKLKEAADIFHELLQEDSSVAWESGELPVVTKATLVHRLSVGEAVQNESFNTQELYKVARIFLRAMK